MPQKNWIWWSAALGAAVGLGYVSWQRSLRGLKEAANVPLAHSRQLLERALPLLRLPTSPDRQPELLPDGAGLRCLSTGRVYTYRNGILDLLAAREERTVTQKTLDTPLTAWFYDRFRETITGALNSPDFATEVAHIQQDLQAGPGDTILDLACGQGNFTVEWAKRVGPSGLVIGLDLSPAMLARAAYHVHCWELNNVLLIRGDAHHLPFGGGVLSKVNCSGGFHQFPDLPRALGEIGRASAPGAILTASTFATGPDDPRLGLKRWLQRRFDLYFVPLIELGQQLATVGYDGYEWMLPGSGWFGYTASYKTT